MGRPIAILLFAAVVTGAPNARAEDLPPPPPLDVSSWYLRGNIDAPSQQMSEGQTYLPLNLLSDLPHDSARLARYSMSETR
jgi:hypothetical protein